MEGLQKDFANSLTIGCFTPMTREETTKAVHDSGEVNMDKAVGQAVHHRVKIERKCHKSYQIRNINKALQTIAGMNAFLLLLADVEVIQGIINESGKPTICVALENIIKTLRVKEGKERIELWKKEPQPHIGLSIISKIHIAMTLLFKE